MAKFFIDRPIFAWVVAIFIIMAGLFSSTKLAIEQYPNVAPPSVNLSFTYPGASAETIQNSVIQLVEEQLNGVENIDYMQSDAYSNGRASIKVTFHSGTDANFAQVDVQNKLSQVESRLPSVVRNQGITVSQQRSNFLMFAAFFAKPGADIPIRDIADFATRTIKPELQRVEGVGNVQVFGSEKAMRIWADPAKLKKYDLSFADIANAITAQNAQIAAGNIGAAPAVAGQQITATVLAHGQLKTPEQFEQIVLKNNADGSAVYLKDVATVSIGQQTYNFGSRLNGQTAVGVGVQLSNTGNAVQASKDIVAKLKSMSQYFPEGIGYNVSYDTSTFVSKSIEKVLHTLVEAIFLVFVVMFIFLQNIRYTIIPTIVVPVSLLGAVAIMYPLGLSINVLTMFAMVLVIGIVVDDAIVVVENVERLMQEERLTPYEATKKGMGQIQGAIVGITLVLISVFVPMAFFSGSIGEIYRQFALVMASAIGVSAFMALSLTPALCATILKPIKQGTHEKKGLWGWFNRGFEKATNNYQKFLIKLVRKSVLMMLLWVVVLGGALLTLKHLPGGFLPSEDQGVVITSFQLPSGATQQRAQSVIETAERKIMAQKEVENMMSILGFSFTGQGENMALAFITLKPWDERTGAGEDATSLVGKFTGMLQQDNRAMIFALNPPPIQGLGNSNGWSLYLEDRNNQGHEKLLAERNKFIAMLRGSKVLSGVRTQGLEDAPQLEITIDRAKAFAQQVSFSSITDTLSAAIGSEYVNDFPNDGRMQRVYIQAQSKDRMQPADVLALLVPNTNGDLVPMSTFTSVDWKSGPQQETRYNGYQAMGLQGNAADGYSTGQAMDAVNAIAAKLDPGFAVEWTGLSLEEIRSGNSQIYLYLFSVLAIFLCLAALYESWSIPFAVLLVLPLGLLGVVFGTFLRGYENDVYFAVGLVTVLGLSAKNAILIIEFAKDLQESGLSKTKAALQAAHIRFRPIIMTSLAFIVGVFPLYIASGASSASQRAIGTSVLWGMLVGSTLAVFFVPIFYVVVRSIFGGGKRIKDKYAVTQQDK